MAKHALCIGINDYPGSGNDLSGCVNDVQDWTAVLESRGFSVKQLLDKQATKSAMIYEISTLIGKCKTGDVAVLQYSGHGSFVPDESGDEPDGKDEVLCPCDVGADSYLTDDDLYDLFAKQQPGVQLIFLSDSCFSGSVSRVAQPVDTPPDAPKSRFLPPAAFLKGARLNLAAALLGSQTVRSRPHQALLISGCQDTQTSADAWFGGRPNGAFTYYAIKALKKLGAQPTYRQWHTAIREFLPSTVYSQRPNLYGSRTQQTWTALA